MIDDEDRDAIAEGRCHRVVEVVCEHDSRLAELLRVNRRDVLAARVVEVVPRYVKLTEQQKADLVIDLDELDPAEYVLGPSLALPGHIRKPLSHHYLDDLGEMLATTSERCCTRKITPDAIAALLTSGRKRQQLPPPPAFHHIHPTETLPMVLDRIVLVGRCCRCGREFRGDDPARLLPCEPPGT